MHLSIHNHSLLRTMVAGAVALAGTAACSHSDRASAGRDTTQTGAVVTADTQATMATQPGSSTPPTTGMQASSDTTMGAPSAGSSKAWSDSAQAARRTTHHRTTGARAAAPNRADQGVAGYQAMGSDSSTASGNGSDSTQVSAAAPQPTDTSSNASVSDTSARSSDTTATVANSSATTEVTSDSTNVGAAPMARDTSVALAQGDTAVQARVDSSSQVQADTATIGDTAVILTQPDTSKTEMAMGNGSDTTAAADTAAVANDSAGAPRIHADTVSQKDAELAKQDRIRPPADSSADTAAVGAAGVTSTGNMVTGSEAVSQMTRGGESCSVAATDEHREVQWDMASSPATMNPCGTGTMTLPRIWTGEKR